MATASLSSPPSVPRSMVVARATPAPASSVTAATTAIDDARTVGAPGMAKSSGKRRSWRRVAVSSKFAPGEPAAGRTGVEIAPANTRTSPAPVGGRVRVSPSPIVAVAPDGRPDRGAHRNEGAAQHDRTIARREARRQQAVVDLACHLEAIELGGGQIQPIVRLATVRRALE